jgi:hypothetical protein
VTDVADVGGNVADVGDVGALESGRP